MIKDIISGMAKELSERSSVLKEKNKTSRRSLFTLDSITISNLLRPEIIFAGVSLLGVSMWALTPQYIAVALVPKGKYVSFTAILYMLLCLTSFWAGSAWQKNAHSKENKPRLLYYLFHDPVRSQRIARALLCISSAIAMSAFLGNVIMLHRGFSLYGSVSGYIGAVYEGSSFGELKRTYFGQEQRIPGITTLIFLTPLSAIISYLVMQASKRFNNRRRYRAALILLCMSLAPGVIALTVTQGSRTPFLLTCIPVVLCHIFLSMKFQMQVFTKVIRNVVIILLIVMIAFSFGDYIRNYLPGQSGHYSVSRDTFGALTFFDIVASNFFSYFFRTVNNGFVIVDYIQTHTYFFRIFNWLYTGLNITDIDPGGLIWSARNEMIMMEASGLAFFGASNASMFGFYFIDLGWAALIIFFILGSLIGRLYAGMKNWAMLSWLIYPIVVTALLDSWRTDMLTKTPSMLPIVGSIIVYFFIKLKFPKYS